MITIRKLARGIEKRLGRTPDEARADAQRILTYFGFRTVIIDNGITPEDRRLFYTLHDAGLLQSSLEAVPLLSGKTWRIFYWELDERDLDRILQDSPSQTDRVYASLPQDAWAHPSASP